MVWFHYERFLASDDVAQQTAPASVGHARKNSRGALKPTKRDFNPSGESKREDPLKQQSVLDQSSIPGR